MTWEQICILVQKYVEANPEVLNKQDVKVCLIRYRIRQERERVPITTTNGPWLDAEKEDKKKAEQIVSKTTVKELREQLMSVITTYFHENKSIPEDDGIDSAINCFKLMLDTEVTTNGACCVRDKEIPFVVGYCCSGGCYRGDASSPVTMPTEDEKEKVVMLLDMINEIPEFLIVSNDCDHCT